MINLVWLRRNLRLDDNLPLFKALQSSDKVQLVYILDTDILSKLPESDDRRVEFIKNALFQINIQLQKIGGTLIVARGKPQELIPRIAKEMGAIKVFADEDYEPSNIKRDIEVRTSLRGIADLELYCDHLIFHPQEIVKSNGEPYRVYTHYMRAFREKLPSNRYLKYESFKLLQGRVNSYLGNIKLDLCTSVNDNIWDVSSAENICEEFISNKMRSYAEKRDYLAEDGTSKISPYLRFGLVSIRELFRKAYEKDNSFSWINELIWREFYTSILYHFPYSANSEFNTKYSNIAWSQDAHLLHKITNAETGYPIIDAAIKQLVTTGWMHNRARMIVASFWTKNLFLDWRLGEKFFAQHLMDYELASNVGGWQWAASCGTDAQPYFRIFNPTLQAEKFDKDGEYIKRYILSLRDMNEKDFHNFDRLKDFGYFPPIVDYALTRIKAIEAFKKQ